MKRLTSLVAVALFASPAWAIDRPASCVTVHAPPHWLGCGTCIASAKGKSLVVSCNHVFSGDEHPEGGFRDDVYPIDCEVSIDGKEKRIAAVAVAGDRKRDLALVVVDAELPASEVAPEAPAAGKVWRFGAGTGATEAAVSDKPGRLLFPSGSFRASGASDSGDSGSAYFDVKGRVVAVHCGKEDDTPRGTPASEIRAFVEKHKPK